MPANIVSDLAAFDVLVAGPSSTPAERLALGDLARAFEADGHRVLSPFEVQPAVRDTGGHARYVAEAVLDADVLVFASGWQESDDAVAVFEQAYALGIPVVMV